MSIERPEFSEFTKIARLNREVVVTEKIDGTNASIVVSDDGSTLWAASRNRYITPEDDNFGFARWCHEHKDALLTLGPGRHFGEWWGAGIQRRYGVPDKRFWLFNVHRMSTRLQGGDPLCTVPGIGVVPVLWRGMLCDMDAQAILADLKASGSCAAPGFMDPEGIVVFHTASGTLYKMTLDKNDQHKGAV